MSDRSIVVRARMSESEAETLANLSRARGGNASETIRRLIAEEAEREERAALVEPFSYMAEKVGEALRKLTLRDDPAAIVDAFAVLIFGDLGSGRQLPRDGFADPNRWVATIEKLMTVSDEDRADPRANREGSMRIRAERMTRDEKEELANALQSLDCWFTDHAR
jgi:hypothetical protein